MIQPIELADKIKNTGFSCTMCGQCCKRAFENSNLVMVSAPEIRRIMKITGFSWEDIAEPYPDILKTPDGARFTFAWSIRRKDDRCIFLDSDSRCMIYSVRPLICRTYPFMLDDEELMTFECPGLGSFISDYDALAIAGELLERAEFEDADIDKTRKIFENADISGDKLHVIDSEGVKIVG